jgi:hypothetical protein
MTITMYDLVFKIMSDLGTIKTQGTATGGSATTLIDTNALRLVENDYFNEGTLFIRADAGGAVDISKQYMKIKDFTQTTKTIEVYGGFATAVTADDTYAAATRRYPLFVVENKINSALYLDGYIPGEDTSLTSVAGQREYTMPVGASRDLRQVLFAASDDSDANEWTPVVNWDVKKTATGYDTWMAR